MWATTIAWGRGIRRMTVSAKEYILPDKTMTTRGRFLFGTGDVTIASTTRRASPTASLVRDLPLDLKVRLTD